MPPCSGNCEKCGGCAGEMVLSQPEIDLLNDLAENAFLPVARKAGDTAPIYREKAEQSPETYSLIVQCLEKKGLISVDFDRPLSGADMSRYADCPIHGSMALTARGQQAMDILDRLGATE